MERKIIVFTVAVTFLIMIITLTIKVQHTAIAESAEFSKQGISQGSQIAATSLEVLDTGSEFGKLSQDSLESILEDCGENSNIRGLEEQYVATPSENIADQNYPDCVKIESEERAFPVLFMEVPVTVQTQDDTRSQGVVIY